MTARKLVFATAGFVKGRELSADIDAEADAIVVGTGAGGGMAARELARAGLSVVALEEGGYHTSLDFNQREEQMLPLLFQDGGGRSTDDLAIRVLQGRGVGGSTVHNTNLCKRTPAPILELWRDKYHVSGCGPAEMDATFAEVERELSVTTMGDDLRNRNNDLLRQATQALGWKGGPLAHNRVGCQKSGFCELGCSYDAKQNARKVLLPQAVEAGGHVLADVRVDKILHDKKRVLGIEGVALTQEGRPHKRVRVRAPVVVLAASAVGSAALVDASRVPDPHGIAGRSLRLHPGAAVAGVFDETVDGYRGIPQSYECTELLSFEEGSDKRAWIVPAFAHPIGAAAMLPGFGAAHMAAMRSYRNLAVFTAMVHDETKGSVQAGSDGRPVIRYRISEADRRQLAKGLLACARLLFAAGAREVTIPAVPPVRLRSVRELDALDGSFVRPHGVPIASVHPMGTLPLGDDPRTSVVSSRGEHHQVRGLFVLDGSLFPTSLGGPPQISVYAFARHLSPHVVAAARKA